MANKTWEFEQGLQTAIKDWDKFNFYCDSIITSVKSESTKEDELNYPKMAEQMANLLASETLSSRSKYLLVLLLKSCIKRNNQFFSRAILRNTAFLEFLQLVLQKGSKLKDPLKRRLFDKPEATEWEGRYFLFYSLMGFASLLNHKFGKNSKNELSSYGRFYANLLTEGAKFDNPKATQSTPQLWESFLIDYFTMMRIGRTILGGLVFEDYTFYNDNVEDYLLMIDELFVEIHKGIYTSLGFPDIKDFNTVVGHIEQNNEIAREYFKRRPEVRSKKLSLNDFKALFRFKNLDDYFDMATRTVKKLDKNHADQIVKLIAQKPDHKHLADAFLENQNNSGTQAVGSKQAVTSGFHNAVHSIAPGRDYDKSGPVPLPITDHTGNLIGGEGSQYGQAAPFRSYAGGSTLSQIGDIAQYIATDKPSLSAEVSALAAQRFESKLGLAADRQKHPEKVGKVPVISVVAKDENLNTLIAERDQLKERLKEKDKMIEKLRAFPDTAAQNHRGDPHDLDRLKRENEELKQKLTGIQRGDPSASKFVPSDLRTHAANLGVKGIQQSVLVQPADWTPQPTLQSFMTDFAPQNSSKKKIVTIDIDDPPQQKQGGHQVSSFTPDLRYQGAITPQDIKPPIVSDQNQSSPIYQSLVSTKTLPVLDPTFAQVDSQTNSYRPSPLSRVDLEFFKDACVSTLGTAIPVHNIKNDLAVRFTFTKPNQDPSLLSLKVEFIHLGSHTQELTQIFAQFSGDNNLRMTSRTQQMYKDRLLPMETYEVSATIQLLSVPFCEVKLAVSYSKNNLPEKKEIIVPVWPHRFATYIAEEVAETDSIHYEAGLQKLISLDTVHSRGNIQDTVKQLFPHGYFNTSGSWTGMFCLLSYDLVFRYEVFPGEANRGKLDFKLYGHSRSGAIQQGKLAGLVALLLNNYEYILGVNPDRS